MEGGGWKLNLPKLHYQPKKPGPAEKIPACFTDTEESLGKKKNKEKSEDVKPEAEENPKKEGE